VFFDQAGDYTVTMTGALNCLDITVSAGTVTFATGTTPTLRVAGSWSTISSTVWNSTGAITFSAFSAKTVNSNNIIINAPVIFGTGTGGSWQLLSNFRLGTAATCIATLTQGTLNLNDLTLTAFALSLSGTSNRVINAGTVGIGQINLTGNNATIINIAEHNNLTSIGRIRIYCSYSGSVGTRTVNIGTTIGTTARWSVQASGSEFAAFLGNNILFETASDTIALAGPMWAEIDLTGFNGILANSTRTIRNRLTLSSTMTTSAGSLSTSFTDPLFSISISTNGTIVNFPISFFGNASLTFLDSFTSTAGITYTGNIDGTTGINLNNFTITASTLQIQVAGATDIIDIDFGTSGKILLTASNTTVLNISQVPTDPLRIRFKGNVYFGSTYTGSVGTRRFNIFGVGANNNTYIKIPDIKITGSTGIILGDTATDTVVFAGNPYNVDLTGFTFTLGNTAAYAIRGKLTIPATGGTIQSGTNAMTLGGIGAFTKDINCNGRLLDFPVNFGVVGTTTGESKLVSEFRVGSTRTVSLLGGGLDLNNNLLITNIFSSDSTTSRVLRFGTTGELRLTGNNATIFDVNGTGFFASGAAYVNSVYAGATGTRTFNGEGVGFNIKTTGTSGVVFASGNPTDTVVFSGYWNDLDLTGLTNTFGAHTGTRVIYGNITIPATGGTIVATSSVTAMGARNTTRTITTNGRLIPFALQIGLDFANPSDGQNLIVNLQEALTTTQSLTIYNGTLALNNFTVTAPNLATPSSSITAYAIDFGTSGQINLTGNNSAIVTIGTGFTFTGTPKIYSTYIGGGAGTLGPSSAWSGARLG
jgi:hypothetical protein